MAVFAEQTTFTKNKCIIKFPISLIFSSFIYLFYYFSAVFVSEITKKHIRTSAADLKLIDDNIILFSTHKNAVFGLNEMLEVREANIILSEGRPYCVIMEAGEFTEFTAEAKTASASEEHTKNRIALALIKKNLATKIIVDLYLKLQKPVGKTKSFTTRKEGLNWLKKMRDAYYNDL
ncbi:hypothetical protein K6119_11150 [Paracrocinitomix mangrovi]|uniref:DUF7793 family protein n=1 Tax=Paracrocinitomix mangrovi TaxID=2862509 RepID=UPI001EDAAB7D|nr:hypothetical protein [Paracrocinitomix mangrovi]UKN00291.1 hypothetical protein K6119_11150 [Paracrocinitomix mangrovi]